MDAVTLPVRLPDFALEQLTAQDLKDGHSGHAAVSGGGVVGIPVIGGVTCVCVPTGRQGVLQLGQCQDLIAHACPFQVRSSSMAQPIDTDIGS